MKKSLLLILFIVAGSLLAVSQQTTSKIGLGFSFGPSFPIGKFGDKSTYSPIAGNPSGWAKIGLAAQVSVSYKINRSFSIDLKGGWQQNDRENASFQQALREQYGADAQISSSARSWNSWKIQIGPEYHIALGTNGKNSIEVGVVAGLLKTYIPGSDFLAYVPGDTTLNSLPSVAQGTQTDQSRPWTFCYQVNAGIQHRVKSNVLISATLNWQQASLAHTYPDFYDPSGNVRPAFKQTYQLGSLNLLLGIIFEL